MQSWTPFHQLRKQHPLYGYGGWLLIFIIFLVINLVLSILYWKAAMNSAPSYLVETIENASIVNFVWLASVFLCLFGSRYLPHFYCYGWILSHALIAAILSQKVPMTLSDYQPFLPSLIGWTVWSVYLFYSRRVAVTVRGLVREEDPFLRNLREEKPSLTNDSEPHEADEPYLSRSSAKKFSLGNDRDRTDSPEAKMESRGDQFPETDVDQQKGDFSELKINKEIFPDTYNSLSREDENISHDSQTPGSEGLTKKRIGKEQQGLTENTDDTSRSAEGESVSDNHNASKERLIRSENAGKYDLEDIDDAIDLLKTEMDIAASTKELERLEASKISRIQQEQKRKSFSKLKPKLERIATEIDGKIEGINQFVIDEDSFSFTYSSKGVTVSEIRSYVVTAEAADRYECQITGHVIYTDPPGFDYLKDVDNLNEEIDENMNFTSEGEIISYLLGEFERLFKESIR